MAARMRCTSLSFSSSASAVSSVGNDPNACVAARSSLQPRPIAVPAHSLSRHAHGRTSARARSPSPTGAAPRRCSPGSSDGAAACPPARIRTPPCSPAACAWPARSTPHPACRGNTATMALVNSSWSSKMSSSWRSYRSAQMCRSASASINCTVTRTRLPMRRTLPSRTYCTRNSRAMSATFAALPL